VAGSGALGASGSRSGAAPSATATGAPLAARRGGGGRRAARSIRRRISSIPLG
jgi:hypothetical protein